MQAPAARKRLLNVRASIISSIMVPYSKCSSSYHLPHTMPYDGIGRNIQAYILVTSSTVLSSQVCYGGSILSQTFTIHVVSHDGEVPCRLITAQTWRCRYSARPRLANLTCFVAACWIATLLWMKQDSALAQRLRNWTSRPNVVEQQVSTEPLAATEACTQVAEINSFLV